jgi:hypothetical protein
MWWWNGDAAASAFGDTVGFGEFCGGRADGNADVVGGERDCVHGFLEPD